MLKFAPYLAIVISAIILMAAVLVQQKGGGLGSTFGADSAVYRTKRGAEKIIFYVTIVMAVIFVGTILVSLILK